jgi:hypothetical protein
MTSDHRSRHFRSRRFLGLTLAAVLTLLACKLSLPQPQQPEPPPPPTISALQAQPGLLYGTTFDEPSEDWETFDDGIIAARFEDGQLILSVNDTNAATWSALAFTFEDFVLDVDAAKLAGPDDNGFGVLFRFQDADNFYRFDISSDGFYALTKVKKGEFSAVSEWAASDAIQTGAATNHIRVVAQGDTFRFEINSQPVRLCVGEGALWDTSVTPPACLGGDLLDAYQDRDFKKGQVAVGVQAFGEMGPVVGFDNLSVSTPEALQ